MADTIESVMTRDPVCLDADTPVVDAAKAMDERNIGDVLVMSDRKLCGIVTIATSRFALSPTAWIRARAA